MAPIGKIFLRLFALLGVIIISQPLHIKEKPPSFLIISLRYLGDVLVTTPLAVSLKHAYPEAIVDYLVFNGTESVLANNPLIRKVITIPHKKYNISTLAALLNTYDVTFGANPSDRTAIVAACAGKISICLSYHRKKEWWKKILLTHDLYCDDENHVVSNILSLLKPLNIPAIPCVSMGYDECDLIFARQAMPGEPYIVLHPFSSNRYKFLPAKTWGNLAQLIREQTGCQVIITRSPASENEAYLMDILAQAGNAASTFTEPCSLSQLAASIKGAVAYVGIDTVVTHLAAAVGTPTFALFGPTLTRYWAPWPNNSSESSPFSINKGIQSKSNVTIIQKDWKCVPCNGMSCRISTQNRMECLEQITPEEVFKEMTKHVDFTRRAT